VRLIGARRRSDPSRCPDHKRRTTTTEYRSSVLSLKALDLLGARPQRAVVFSPRRFAIRAVVASALVVCSARTVP
jgi:hypothetical protein